jgi:hypothetical protein
MLELLLTLISVDILNNTLWPPDRADTANIQDRPPAAQAKPPWLSDRERTVRTRQLGCGQRGYGDTLH